jgi:hypothetical protein
MADKGCVKRLQKEYHALCKVSSTFRFESVGFGFRPVSDAIRPVAGAAAADRGSPAAQRHIGVA